MQFDEPVRVQYLGDISSWGVPIFTLIFISTIFHSLFFYFLPSSLTSLIKSYIVSTFHASIGVLSVCNFFARYSVNLKQINRIAGGGIYGTGDEIMIYAICYSYGYFIYDLLVMSYYKSTRTKTALAHHIMIILIMSLGISNRVCHPCHFYLLAEEFSTIPLNLKAIYRHRPRLQNIFTYLFVVSFFLSRLIYGSIICGYAFRAAAVFAQMALNIGDMKNFVFVLFQVLLCVLSRILNFYWAILILQKIFYLQQSKKKSSSLTNNQVLKKKIL